MGHCRPRGDGSRWNNTTVRARMVAPSEVAYSLVNAVSVLPPLRKSPSILRCRTTAELARPPKQQLAGRWHRGSGLVGSPAPEAQRGPRKPPDLAASDVVQGGELSRPPGYQGCQLVRLSVRPGPPTRLLGMPVRSDPGRLSPASAGRSCCRHAALKIKKGLTAFDDQAPDLHLLGSGGGI